MGGDRAERRNSVDLPDQGSNLNQFDEGPARRAEVGIRIEVPGTNGTLLQEAQGGIGMAVLSFGIRDGFRRHTAGGKHRLHVVDKGEFAHGVLQERTLEKWSQPGDRETMPPGDIQ
ncbi:hypothetical protein FQZ97_678190 [compost metagenome]